MNKITMQKDGTLSVPDVPVVPYITGDGVGAEVTPSMQAVVNAAVQKAYGGKRRIECGRTRFQRDMFVVAG